MTDDEIIRLIEERKEHKALKRLYRYRGKVEQLIQQRGGTKTDAHDVFQEALIVLCKRIWAGDFKLTSKLDTYLYSVCYYTWKNELKSRNAKPATLIIDEISPAEESRLEELVEREQQITALEATLRKLGNPCMKLLQLFYYEKQRMAEIMKVLGHKSPQTTKAQKYKCMERLKKAMPKTAHHA